MRADAQEFLPHAKVEKEAKKVPFKPEEEIEAQGLEEVCSLPPPKVTVTPSSKGPWSKPITYGIDLRFQRK